MKIVGIYNQKGGVGKTTLAVNLSEQFYCMGLNVLLLDADSQGNATAHLGVNKDRIEAEHTIWHGLAHSVRPLIFPTESGVDLGAVTKGAKVFKRSLMEESNKFRLRDYLDSLGDEYDVVVIDGSPSDSVDGFVGQMLHAVDGLIFPVQAELPAFQNLAEAQFDIFKDIEPARLTFGLDPIRYLGIIPMMYNRQVKSHRELLEILPAFAERMGCPVLPGIKHNTLIKEAMGRSCTLEKFFASTSTQAKNKREAIADFEELTLFVAGQLHLPIQEKER